MSGWDAKTPVALHGVGTAVDACRGAATVAACNAAPTLAGRLLWAGAVVAGSDAGVAWRSVARSLHRSGRCAPQLSQRPACRSLPHKLPCSRCTAIPAACTCMQPHTYASLVVCIRLKSACSLRPQVRVATPWRQRVPAPRRLPQRIAIARPRALRLPAPSLCVPSPRRLNVLS